ncbi:MAG: ribosome assembly RNA-binding protein YhbY [SAR324 cluster bacterium]|uniref:Ribosome assembly RNA-binding protein YhbY n=1 Tax=SAR324 cluster bacterium TaxID=2024889 RepID=A0A2A4SYJ1_9DELT|nr:MAG: ribosome assembly RNA-binding protein YhbY [SAR324 cluster bacterium]
MTDQLKTLTGKQARYLRGLAHSMKPLLQMGKSGLTETFIQQLDSSLEHHELLKVKVIKTSEMGPKEAAKEIAAKINCHVAHVIGKTLILYRQRKKDPEIVLPK